MVASGKDTYSLPLSLQNETHKYFLHRFRIMQRRHGAHSLEMRTKIPEVADRNSCKINDEDRAWHSTIDMHPRT